MENAKSVALYTRVSTRGQNTTIQKKRLIEYCESKGYELYQLYDEQNSGITIKKRPVFNKLMEDAKAGKFNAIMVTKLDRFGRSVKDLVSSMEILKQHSIEFISVDDNIDTSTHIGQFMFHVISAFAEFERNIIIERIIEGRKIADKFGSKSGLPCHRPRKKIDMKLVEEYYNKGISLTAIGKLVDCSPGTISRRLKERGVKLKRTWVEES